MSNRIEELAKAYKKYRLKRFIKVAGFASTTVACVFVSYILIQGLNVKDTSVKQSKAYTHVPKTSVQRPTYKPEISVNELNKVLKKREKKIIVKRKRKKINRTKVPFVAPVKSNMNYFTNIQEPKSLEVWIDKYNQKKSYGSAIYLSKQYYVQKDYKKAGIWAKRANQINRDKEEAWLYYAKSVYSLGHMNKARRILGVYLKYKKSIKAELLLSEWNS